jgi:hypothetical protein
MNGYQDKVYKKEYNVKCTTVCCDGINKPLEIKRRKPTPQNIGKNDRPGIRR